MLYSAAWRAVRSSRRVSVSGRVGESQRGRQQRVHQGIIADHGGLVGGVAQQSDDV
jgi:hypothetical protein